MESEPLLRDSTLGDGPAEVDERGPSASNSSKLTLLAKPQLLIVLLIFLSEPIVAFMPTPFLAQVYAYNDQFASALCLALTIRFHYLYLARQ